MKITVKVNDTSYDVEVGDVNSRPIQATLNGETYDVWPDESGQATVVTESAKPVEKPHSVPVVHNAPAPQTGGDASKTISAPIPGVILSIAIKAGDQVTSGQEVCILEAMKMKNSIKSTRAGKVSVVRINAGDHVQHGQILFEFSD